MNIEEIDIKDIEFGEPIEEREPNYRDGYIRGIYRARNIIDNQCKEIERLKSRLEEYQEYVEINHKEIERLNNIINELEKWLEQEYAIVKANSIQEPNNPEWYIKWNERKNTLDKLQELKRSDKE